VRFTMSAQEVPQDEMNELRTGITDHDFRRIEYFRDGRKKK